MACGPGALLGLASAVKLDIRALEGRALINAVARLRERDMQLVAEKVETREEYAVCRALGFDAFQTADRTGDVTAATAGTSTTSASAIAPLGTPLSQRPTRVSRRWTRARAAPNHRAADR